MRTASIAFVLLLGAAFAMPASADNDKDKGHGRSHGQGQGQDRGANQNHGKGDNDNERGRAHDVAAPNRQIVPYQNVVIIDRDRDRMHNYYRTEYAAGRCPPGLAKKNNGCVPPGHAKQVWIVGQSLPKEVVYYPMPRELWTQLTPPPYGYEYVRVDNNVLLMNSTSRLIAAILSNLGG